jgi:hypothetical protein
VAVRVRNDRALVYANVGVHADVEITVTVSDEGGGAFISIGPDGPDLRLEVADLASMERLATVATEGAQRMRELLAVGAVR